MTLSRALKLSIFVLLFMGCQQAPAGDDNTDGGGISTDSSGPDDIAFPRADLPPDGSEVDGSSQLPQQDATVSPEDASPSDLGPDDAGSVPDLDSGAGEIQPGDGGQIGGGPPVTMNASFIGSACATDADCAYDGGICLTEQEGFPGGMCSKACSKYCPDQDGMVTTFCVDPDDLAAGPVPFAGACAMQCRFGPSPTGCRDGYRCMAMARYSEPETQKFTCVPGSPDEPGSFEITACHQGLLEEGIAFSPGFNPMASPANHPSLICDVPDPVHVPGHMHGVNFRYNTDDAPIKDIFAACQLGLSLSKSAKLLAAQGVTDVLHLGVYNCRVIGGTDPPILSEHGLANAIDIRALVNSEGVMTVLNDWEKNTSLPATDEGAFLKWFVETVFEQDLFNIILTPDYNAAHADHFHMDLTEGANYLK